MEEMCRKLRFILRRTPFTTMKPPINTSHILKRWRDQIRIAKTKIIKAKFGYLGKDAVIAFPLYYYGLENVYIGNGFQSGERLKLRTFSEWAGERHNPKITIGNNVSLQSDCHISAIDSVEIGNDVLIASFVFISDHQHGNKNYTDLNFPPLKRELSSKGPVVIEEKVWIGEKVTILPGVIIGRSSIIGAGSVVTKSIPPFSIACGNPAKVIKTVQ